ncbi:MAG: 50S ribosomal protein L19 [Planctomycetaceae bacterium]|nr:50S ribosomal protein L19 [Planctomycetaceae bacterium]
MSQSIMEAVEADHLKSDLPAVNVGDTVDVHMRIIEGEKERIQVFGGVVIAIKGRGINRMMTVRRIVANEGVERVLPMHSPRIAQIDIVRRGHARRAKLFFLRDRVGKSRRLRDRRRGLAQFEAAIAPERVEDEAVVETTGDAGDEEATKD